MAVVMINLLGVRVEISGGTATCRDKQVEHVINLMIGPLHQRHTEMDFDQYAALRVADWLGGNVVRQEMYIE